MKKVVEFLGGSSISASTGDLQLCRAPMVGEGFFHKEGSNVRSWKYRSYGVFEGGLLQYYSSQRMIRGQIDLSVVEFSTPERGRLEDFILPTDTSSVGLCMFSIREAREMCVVFRTMEECMYFLYFASVASPQNNVTTFVSSMGVQQQFIACMEKYKAVKARSSPFQVADFYYYESDTLQLSPEGLDSAVSSPSDPLSAPSSSSPLSPISSAGLPPLVSSGSPPPRESARPERPNSMAIRPSIPSISRATTVGAIDSLFLSLISEDAPYAKMLALLRSRVILGEEFPHLSRAVWWRLSLNLLSRKGSSRWAADLNESISKYFDMKKELLPVLSLADVDPLMTTGNIETPVDGEWGKYYKVREIANFIQLDIDRLYLNGVDEAYFEDRDRCVILQNILLMWAVQNEEISYRQGMHEIAGVILIVVENELNAWTDSTLPPSDFQRLQRHPLKGCFSRENIEPYAYWLFDKIMEDLKMLFDPKPESDGQPKVVHYCNNVQDVLLRNVDFDLSLSIEGQAIQSQLYGMRWSRVLLSREFSSIERQVLRIWDYIIVMASCGETGVGEVIPVSNTSAAVSTPKTPSRGNTAAASPAPGDKSQVSLPAGGVNIFGSMTLKPKSILDPLRYVMVAMLVNIRGEILENDSCTSLSVLMRYPDVQDARTIVELSYLIAKGVYKVAPAVDDSSRPKSRPLVYRGLQKLGSTVAQKISLGAPLLQALTGNNSAPAGPTTSGSAANNSSVPGSMTTTNTSGAAMGAGGTTDTTASSIPPPSSGTYADSSALPSISLWPSKPAASTGARVGGSSGGNQSSSGSADGGFEMEMGDVDSAIGPSGAGRSKNAALATMASPAGLSSSERPVYREVAGFEAKSFVAVGKVLLGEGERLVKAADAAALAFQRSKYEDDAGGDDSGSDDDEHESKGANKSKTGAAAKTPELNAQALAAQLRCLADVLVREKTWDDFEAVRRAQQPLWKGLE